jgi:hypothetical protein
VGPRVPYFDGAQKKFNTAIVVITLPGKPRTKEQGAPAVPFVPGLTSLCPFSKNAHNAQRQDMNKGKLALTGRDGDERDCYSRREK